MSPFFHSSDVRHPPRLSNLAICFAYSVVSSFASAYSDYPEILIDFPLLEKLRFGSGEGREEHTNVIQVIFLDKGFLLTNPYSKHSTQFYYLLLLQREK